MIKLDSHTHIDDVIEDYNVWLLHHYELHVPPKDIDKIIWWLQVLVAILLKTFKDKWV